MNLELDEIGNVMRWETRFGPVIYPRSREDSRWRGGSHVNLPVQGRVPTDNPSWAGVTLDQHGFLRNGREFFRGKSDDGKKRVFSFTHEARDVYPWSLAAEIELKTSSGEDADALTYSLTVARDRKCTNTRGMPYSMGLHPYFAVQEGGFEVLIGDTKVMEKGECEANSPKFFPLTGDWPTASFVTGSLHLSFIAHGADEMIFWTDCPEKYACLVFVYNRRNGICLEKGQPHQLLVGMVARQA